MEKRGSFCLSFHITAMVQERWGRNSNRIGTWCQELVWRPWRTAACWHPPHGLFSLLSYTLQYHLPRNSAAHRELGPPTSNISQENTSQASLAGAFSQLRFPLPKHLCQVAIELASTAFRVCCHAWLLFSGLSGPYCLQGTISPNLLHHSYATVHTGDFFNI